MYIWEPCIHPTVCPLTKFEGGLQSLHEAGDDAIYWLEFTAATALAK